MERTGRTTRRDVVEAAVAVLDEVGEPALTMAAVAGRLGLSTMASYRHVKDRAELVAAAVDLVLEDVAVPSDEVAWVDGVVDWMTDVRATLVTHPWVGPNIGDERSVARAWLAVVVRLIRVLERSPLTVPARARAVVWVTRTTTGLASQEVRAPMSAGGADPTTLLAMVDGDDRATLATVVDAIAAISDDALFDLAIEQARTLLRSLDGADGHGGARRRSDR